MFILLYRWRISPEKEKQFIEGWSEVTTYFLENWNSLGSRLHRGGDGLFYAYAQWHSAEDRQKAFDNSIDLESSAKMKEAVLERFEPINLERLSDYLILPEK